MATLFRGILAFGGGGAAFFFALWIVTPVLLTDATPVGVSLILSLLAGVLAGRWAWTGLAAVPEGLASAVATGGLTLGGLGFLGGFFGPMVFAPDANQGPLLGIFITGPIGFVVGALAGGLLWWRRRAVGG